MGSIGAVFHGGSPASPASPTSTVLRPVFPSVPSPRLGIPTSSGHGIHSARKVKAVAVCAQDPLSVATGSAGRQKGCSSSSTRSTFPLCSAHVQQRQPR